MNEHNFPVWHTQGGGLVRYVGGKYIFIKAPPKCPGLKVGDEMPAQWGVIPANRLAQKEKEDMATSA